MARGRRISRGRLDQAAGPAPAAHAARSPQRHTPRSQRSPAAQQPSPHAGPAAQPPVGPHDAAGASTGASIAASIGGPSAPPQPTTSSMTSIARAMPAT